MSEPVIRDQTLALAGLFQALVLIQRLARQGRAHPLEALRASLGTLLVLDAPDTEAVYGGRQNLRLGLDTLKRQFDTGRGAEDEELTRYAAGVLYLERRFARQSGTAAEVSDLLRELASEHGFATDQPVPRLFETDWTDPAIIGRFADLYVTHISPLGQKILVRGEPAYLQPTPNSNLIRALLLAALRSVVLWRQLGGSRWQMMLNRRRIQRALWALAD
ncbi:MAG: lysogenization regulator HflD [Gammaproteobacteria bacterium]|nr:lysogenization regulator HflD [Gammaproteobacteria bacterium]